jgi:hypothetical protein
VGHLYVPSGPATPTRRPMPQPRHGRSYFRCSTKYLRVFSVAHRSSRRQGRITEASLVNACLFSGHLITCGINGIDRLRRPASTSTFF